MTWPEATAAIGIAWAIAFTIWVVFRHGIDIQFRDPLKSVETPRWESTTIERHPDSPVTPEEKT